ncbi:DEAD/DEAH box helicase [Mesoterricola sediminis]|uniref:DEAD/DEAH box helicase n=1 Tax=Mesoterricola sediminis TaxID=2927980 RepID=A0AA48KDT3_9BACT|nr:DEAD/DEAH box helicase [Mesoterricola sediminis]BDU76657.1 DEAD/DEAH box helicase [Mesoterricola sediminis]
MTHETFAALGCTEPFLSALARRGFTAPTLVQAETFQPGLEGRDLLVQSRTGSGKTLAFGLPLLHRLKDERKTQAIILTPTRELAQQVAEELQSVMPRLDVALLVGGLSYVPQLKALKFGAQVVVGTPGRVQDHLDRQTLDLTEVGMVVLDECDEMLNMGFLEDVEKILAGVPPTPQTYLFSATLPAPIASLARRFLKDPVRINHAASEGGSQHADIAHTPCIVPEHLQVKALVNFLLADAPSAALIFTKMKVQTEEVAQALRDAGLAADCLHGDLGQQARNRIMGNFKEGRLRYLVATDVAARGIDVEGMPLVVHLGIPTQMESYIHRSGRTGRAGSKGSSLALVTFKESRILLAWSRRGGLKLEWRAVPTQAEIREKRTQALLDRVGALEAPGMEETATRLLEGRGPVQVVAALLSLVEGPEHAGFDIPDAPRQEYASEKRPFKPRPGEKPGWTPGKKPFRREDRPEGAGEHRPFKPRQGEKGGWVPGKKPFRKDAAGPKPFPKKRPKG